MRYERKIFVGFLLAIGAFLPLVGLSLYTIQKIVADESSIIEANARQTLLIERLQFFNAAKMREIPVYILTRESAHLESFYEFHRLFNSVLDEVMKLDERPENAVLLQKIKRDSDAAYVYVTPGLNMLKEGKSIRTVDRYFHSTTVPISREIVQAARQLAINAAQHESDARVRMKKTIWALEELIIALAVLAALLTGWGAVLVLKVSRQKRLVDQQTERISRARKEIVEIVAHDLKSPLATIQMTAELMKDELPSVPAASSIHRSVEMIGRSSQAMSRLITDLLDHAKIESGNLTIDAKPCDLEAIVENVASRFQTLARAKRIHFHIDIAHEEMAPSCDSARIDQALSNLLSNAIKFTPEEGHVTISCHRVASAVQISVEDSGQGLTEEQIPHIFDRYWQARQSNRQGTGLGLAIVKSIIDAHRGNVWVESQPEHGSKFFMSLPV